MVKLVKSGHYLIDGKPVPVKEAVGAAPPEAARQGTIAYQILQAHNKSREPGQLRLTFDALISHDITYVGIIQTARASGLTEFPVPYALTCCHNSLCAVGGTINEDDHAFGLSAAKKYGGIFVPPNQAVIHQYARERLAFCGGMILGSDSHTRYGSYGCMGIGEGGGELVKQLLKNTYDLPAPEVVLVYLDGRPRKGVGPMDVALALISATFADGSLKNKILEFTGPGLANMSADYRIGIDVMTTETTCLSSIWETDEIIAGYYKNIGRPECYKKLAPAQGCYYDSLVTIDLSAVECMIALPFHPSSAYPISAVQADPAGVFAQVEETCNRQLDEVKLDLQSCIQGGKVQCEQGVIVGCAGGMYENLMIAAEILKTGEIGNDYFDLSVYPSSAPISLALTKSGAAADLMEAGSLIKPAFCGPCFGAGDTPAHNTLSIRHATRNFPNRDGSKPGDGQMTAIALMDARSIAATAANGGILTAATEVDYAEPDLTYHFDGSIYEKRCYQGFGSPQPDVQLRLGPNIKDWPRFPALKDDLLINLTAVIHDPVTTTDELIPSGETSSYRSNPLKLSEFTLSRRCPDYVAKSKDVLAIAEDLRQGRPSPQVVDILALVGGNIHRTSVGSCIFARKPGDGSAREQAASCQKVLGGLANICYEYATKRYRSNCINWGIVPFTVKPGFDYDEGDWVYVSGLRKAIADGASELPAKVITSDNQVSEITLSCTGLTDNEKQILLEGCLMNYYAAGHKE
ncbi:MAG: hydratase [Oscillospiraceae bacterium]|nr:hydratase [Oscillospiraceae bacterium]